MYNGTIFGFNACESQLLKGRLLEILDGQPRAYKHD